MSEHFPITPNENDKNVLAPLHGQIAVMRLSSQFDEAGRQIAYQLDKDGKTAATLAGVPEAYSDKVQEHYAHKLAMDRNPTPEQMERGTPPKVITDLGGAALESTVVAPITSETSGIRSEERESGQEAGMDIMLVEDVIGTLSYVNANSRHLPEAEGRRNLNAHIVKKANGAYDALKAGKISTESYAVMTNSLLGAASSRDSIDTVVGMLMDSETLDMDARTDLSSHANTIKEIASVTGLDGERARISFANSLIARSEHLLKKNNNVADNRYRAMVGFIAGLSTQIKDPSTSNGFVHGALNELRKHS